MGVIFTNARVVVSTDDPSTTTITDGRVDYDISARVLSVNLERTHDLHDVTVMGQTARQRVTGLEDWTAEIELIQSLSSADGQEHTERRLSQWADIGSTGQVIYLAIRPTNSCSTTGNPEFVGAAILESYTPMEGAVGDVLQTTVPFRAAGDLSRQTSASSSA